MLRSRANARRPYRIKRLETSTHESAVGWDHPTGIPTRQGLANDCGEAISTCVSLVACCVLSSFANTGHLWQVACNLCRKSDRARNNHLPELFAALRA